MEEHKRREMKGPSFNMNQSMQNKGMNDKHVTSQDVDDLKRKMREKLNTMSSKRLGYHAQSVTQVKQEQREEQLKQEKEEAVRLELEKKEKKRQKERERKKRQKARKADVTQDESDDKVEKTE